MRTTFAAAVVVATANALVARDTPPCCFGLSATGGATGAVGQIDDGQTRIGSGLGPSQFCIDVSGAITDGSGRGCHLTPPTSQLQCDNGQVPQPGFSIDTSGKLHHNDSTSFVACQSGQSDQMNIYTSPAPTDVTGCQPIELQSDKCQPPGAPPGPPGPPSPPGPPGPPAPPAPSAPAPPQSAPPIGPSVGPGGPSPSGSAPPVAPSPPSVSSACHTTAPCESESTTPVPQSPGSAGTGGPGTGQAGSTTSCPSNVPEGPSGPRTPSAPRSPGGGPTAPGPPPFANTSAPAPTGNATKPTAPGSTGGASPTGGVTPAPGAGGSCGGGSKGGCGGAVCGTTLVNGSFEFPHLIIPIDSSAPSKAPGTSFNGTVTSTISSIFNFDFGQNVTGKQCSLVFLFPTQDQLETSAFSFSGDGAIKFSELEAPASNQTSFSNAPGVKVDFGVTDVSPGHSYGITTFACPAGETLAFELKNAGTTNLDFFEDFNPSPIGLFITTC